MFSVLGSINTSFYINNVYNFLFYFPDDFPDGFVFFNQSSHPLYSRTVSDFNEYTIHPSKYRLDKREDLTISGLKLFDYENTLLHANTHETSWMFAVGCNTFWPRKYMIPGPYVGVPEVGVQTIELWIRIKYFSNFENLPSLDLCVCSQPIAYYNNIHVLFVYINVFISI